MVVEGVTGTLLAVGIFAFGLGNVGTGLFTAYFGAGKSRGIGFSLAFLGVAVLAVFAVLTWPVLPQVTPVFVSGDVIFGLVGVLAAGIGGVVALVVFLVSIMNA